MFADCAFLSSQVLWAPLLCKEADRMTQHPTSAPAYTIYRDGCKFEGCAQLGIGRCLTARVGDRSALALISLTLDEVDATELLGGRR
jgi:hypothetical protein